MHRPRDDRLGGNMLNGMQLAVAEAVAASLVAAGANVARAYPSTEARGLYEVRVRLGGLRQTIRRAEEVPRLLARMAEGAVPTLQETLEEQGGQQRYTEGDTVDAGGPFAHGGPKD